MFLAADGRLSTRRRRTTTRKAAAHQCRSSPSENQIVAIKRGECLYGFGAYSRRPATSPPTPNDEDNRRAVQMFG